MMASIIHLYIVDTFCFWGGSFFLLGQTFILLGRTLSEPPLLDSEKVIHMFDICFYTFVGSGGQCSVYMVPIEALFGRTVWNQ